MLIVQDRAHWLKRNDMKLKVLLTLIYLSWARYIDTLRMNGVRGGRNFFRFQPRDFYQTDFNLYITLYLKFYLNYV